MSDARHDVLAVIPARYGAQRFPGKPLALIAKKPMIEWVWGAARAARRVTRVVVATDDERIAACVKSFGGEVMMTSPRCPSGTDRVAQVARASRAGIIVNVQGDEPLLASTAIDRVVEALQTDSSAVMSTVVRKADNDKEWKNPNAVKAVIDRMNYALYFSRAPIPAERGPSASSRAPHWIHLGLYAFRRPFLFRFAGLPPSILEESEKLEQLRVLEYGCSIKVAIIKERSQAVDVPADIKRVERILAQSHSKKSERL